MKKNRLTYSMVSVLCLLGMWTLVAACTSDAENTGSDSGEPISLYTSVTGRDATSTPESIGKGEELWARLLFWRVDDYHKFRADDSEWPTPFLDIVPTEEIDYYQVKNGIPFNTRHSYPPGNGQVHVLGYAPSELEPVGSYKTLEIPEPLRDGKNDFLSGDGNRYRVGSADKPFEESGTFWEGGETAALEQKQLEFCHLTAKILVKAQRHKNMELKVGVRNVKVTLHNQQVPTRLEWKAIPDEDGKNDDEWGGYFPADPTEPKNIELARASTDLIVLDQVMDVDSCYVYAENSDAHSHEKDPVVNSGKITLTMDVTADLFPFDADSGQWAYGQSETRKWSGVEVEIDSNTGGQLKMGYVYQIIITFDTYDIRLQGIEMEWENGGTHYVPITPVEDSKQD